MAQSGAIGRPAVTRVAIDRNAAGGDGVGRLPDGMTVFVPRTAPGDVADVHVAERRPRFARGVLTELAVAGPERVAPPCDHYVVDRCGGCQLQHLSSDEQLRVKRAVVGDALRRIGRRQVSDPPIVPAPSGWRYRTRITLAAKSRGAGPPAIGLRRRDDAGDVFDLSDCLITREALMGLWTKLQRQRQFLPLGLRSVMLREDWEGGRHVILQVDGGESPGERIAAAVGGLGATLWWQDASGPPRAVGKPVSPIPVFSFEQVNPEFGDRIRCDAVEALGDVSGRTVWDLYGGTGKTARLLASRGARVTSVDLDRSAIAWARRGGGRAGPGAPAIQYIASRVEHVLDRLPEPDVIVANPPRAGLHTHVSKWVTAWATSAPRRHLSYVSCDPATLARDLGRMPPLRLAHLMAYDLFPQTAHVEILAVLESG